MIAETCRRAVACMRNNIVLQVPKESEIGGSSFFVISYIAVDYVSPFRSRDHPFVYLFTD
jgi:hypothetical protein